MRSRVAPPRSAERTCRPSGLNNRAASSHDPRTFPASRNSCKITRQTCGRSRGEERPGFAQATIQVSNVVFPYRYLCLIAIVAAFGFFEWMYKSENKTSIRTTEITK